MANATYGLVVTQDDTLTPSYAALVGGGYVLDLAGNVAISHSPTGTSGVSIVVAGSVTNAAVLAAVKQWVKDRDTDGNLGAAGGQPVPAVNFGARALAGSDAATGSAFPTGTWTPD